MNDELMHYGVLGMKWGVRRYQNPDGSRTELGKRHEKTLFVSGSSKTQDKSSGYYRKKLPYGVRYALKDSMGRHHKIIVGDAPGIDRQVQDYLKKKKYDKVEVYGPGKGPVRYAADPNWKTNSIDSKYKEGSKQWLAAKDKAMTKAADYGLAVQLDEGSSATRKNVERLLKQMKDVNIVELSKKGKWHDKFVEPGERIANDILGKAEHTGITKRYKAEQAVNDIWNKYYGKRPETKNVDEYYKAVTKDLEKDNVRLTDLEYKNAKRRIHSGGEYTPQLDHLYNYEKNRRDAEKKSNASMLKTAWDAKGVAFEELNKANGSNYISKGLDLHKKGKDLINTYPGKTIFGRAKNAQKDAINLLKSGKPVEKWTDKERLLYAMLVGSNYDTHHHY